MVEHTPWRGRNYCKGIDGQRLAIAGYSHYLQPDHTDDDNFTRGVIEQDVLNKERSLSFFNQIAGYFRMDLDFWDRVVFFNFLPDCVGDENEKFKDGTPDQIKLGKLRVLRITRELKPHKMIVFTYKGWEAFPSTDEETTGLGGTTPLGESYPPKFRWGTYCFDGQTTTAFGLRHPQGANGELMRRAVSTIMETPKRD